jgi:hypothetical protein
MLAGAALIGAAVGPFVWHASWPAGASDASSVAALKGARSRLVPSAPGEPVLRASAGLCTLLCSSMRSCFAARDGGAHPGPEHGAVSRCAEQCSRELGICPQGALAQARTCLELPLRQCDRAEIDECVEALTIDCVALALADAGAPAASD